MWNNLFPCVYLFVPDYCNEGIRETSNRCALNSGVGACRSDDARGRGGAVCLQNDRSCNQSVPGPGLEEGVRSGV